MPAPPLSNTFESGQPDTTVITTGNSGAPAGDAFQNIQNSPTYSITHFKNGTRSMRIDTTGTYTDANVDWTGLGSITTDIWGRQYLWMDARPVSSSLVVAVVRNNAAANSALVRIRNDTGAIDILDPGFTGRAVGSVAVASSQWIRLEWRVRSSTTVGQVEWLLYNNPDAPLGSHSDTNSATGLVLAANSDRVDFGANGGSGPASYIFWTDNIAVSSSAQLGPVTPDASTNFIYLNQSNLRLA